MNRLPTMGAQIAAPRLDEREFRRVLNELGASDALNDADIHKLYLRTGEVYGRWLSEQEAKNVSPVAKALLSTGKNLMAASRILAGHETGFRTHVEVEATSHTARILALDLSIGSLEGANGLISTFQKEAARIGEACMVAYVDLTQKRTKKASQLGWYDDFTAILLDIADIAGVEPSLGKDRAKGFRTGWLFKAAQLLEPFLDPFMRSPTAEACGKRLERSRKQLSRPKRQIALSH